VSREQPKTGDERIEQFMRILVNMRSGLVVTTDRFCAINDVLAIARGVLTPTESK
jgi:hypothetical protein